MANPSENPNFGISGGPSHSGMEVDNDSIKELQRQQLEITKTIEKLMTQLTSQSAQKISSNQRSSVKEPEVFKGKTEEELDKLAQSFKFENCAEREGLNKVLREHAKELAKSAAV